VLSQRPAEAEGRAVPWHWVGDLIIGLERSAIGSLVERTTRFAMLVHLPRAEGYRVVPRTKSGPPLAGYGAIAMKDARAASMTTLPEQLRQSLTWVRGKELAQHAQFKVETGIAVYFADPTAPGSGPRPRTPTASCASTSRRAPTSHVGMNRRSTQCPQP